MAVRMTPPLYAKGLYEVSTPWELPPPARDYVCTAIRGFEDFYVLGEDPFDLFYAPLNVDRNRFDEDAANSASIITLESVDGEVVMYIPDTFILSYPDQNTVPYADLVLQFKLSKLPEYYDVSAIVDDIQELIDTRVGNTNNENSVDIFPIQEYVSLADSHSLEAARKAAITDTDTWYSKYLKEKEINENLQAEIAIYQQALEDNGIVGP